ncbi:hypothetical protein Pelo_15135 [Pelomyxa schiedti]|nr:hypothetical protein Pelo_15135 [Pelomyxa schiedti]
MPQVALDPRGKLVPILEKIFWGGGDDSTRLGRTLAQSPTSESWMLATAKRLLDVKTKVTSARQWIKEDACDSLTIANFFNDEPGYLHKLWAKGPYYKYRKTREGLIQVLLALMYLIKEKSKNIGKGKDPEDSTGESTEEEAEGEGEEEGEGEGEGEGGNQAASSSSGDSKEEVSNWRGEGEQMQDSNKQDRPLKYFIPNWEYTVQNPAYKNFPVRQKTVSRFGAPSPMKDPGVWRSPDMDDCVKRGREQAESKTINGVWGNEDKAAVAEVAKQLNAEYCRIDFRELDNKTEEARLALFTEHYNRHKDFRESENMKFLLHVENLNGSPNLVAVWNFLRHKTCDAVVYVSGRDSSIIKKPGIDLEFHHSCLKPKLTFAMVYETLQYYFGDSSILFNKSVSEMEKVAKRLVGPRSITVSFLQHVYDAYVNGTFTSVGDYVKIAHSNLQAKFKANGPSVRLHKFLSNWRRILFCWRRNKALLVEHGMTKLFIPDTASEYHKIMKNASELNTLGLMEVLPLKSACLIAPPDPWLMDLLNPEDIHFMVPELRAQCSIKPGTKGFTFEQSVMIEFSKPLSLLLMRIFSNLPYYMDTDLHQFWIPFVSLKEITKEFLADLKVVAWCRDGMGRDTHKVDIRFLAIRTPDGDNKLPLYMPVDIQATCMFDSPVDKGTEFFCHCCQRNEDGIFVFVAHNRFELDATLRSFVESTTGVPPCMSKDPNIKQGLYRKYIIICGAEAFISCTCIPDLFCPTTGLAMPTTTTQSHEELLEDEVNRNFQALSRKLDHDEEAILLSLKHIVWREGLLCGVETFDRESALSVLHKALSFSFDDQRTRVLDLLGEADLEEISILSTLPCTTEVTLELSRVTAVDPRTAVQRIGSMYSTEML